MASATHCANCGVPLPGGALGNRCPKCLLAIGLDEEIERETPVEEQKEISTGHVSHSGFRRFGDYDLIEEIGRGGMGVVFKARQLSLNRIVAVKMLLAGQFASPEFVRRFRAEAQAAANLRHPNIVAIHDFGEYEGQHYFSMDYVEGRELAHLIREQPLPARQAARYVQILAQAIHFAHQNGVLHRDLKPSNVLIDADDQPRITDFGLAKRLTDHPQLTTTGQTLGSPNYMPPEQAGGGQTKIGPASDVYSLGAILYHLLTGRPPFVAATIAATLRAVQETEPIAPRMLNPSLSHDLETICLKCLEKEPRRRFASAQELADELGRYLRDEPIHTRPVSAPEKFWRWCRRNPRLATLSTAAVALVGVIAVGSPLAIHRINEARVEAVKFAKAESRQRQRAESTLRRLELQSAQEMFGSDKAPEALAIMASLLRQDPSDRAVASRILNELTHRSFALPVLEPLQHDDAVFFAEFSADGRKVLTTSRNNSVQIWDVASGLPLTPPLRHQSGLVRSGDFIGPTKPLFARFSPDGTRVVTGSIDQRARVWDASNGQPVTPWLEHPSPIICVQFSPDGKLVAVGCTDGTAQLWEAETGHSAGVLSQHTKTVSSIEFAPDGQRMITASEDRTVQLWDVAARQPVGPPMRHADWARFATFSPDGERFVTAGGPQDHTARIWSARTGEPLLAPLHHDATLNLTEFSPDGLWLVTASFDKTARVWDAHSGQPVGQPLRHRSVVRTAHFSPDGQRVVTASEDKTARVWDFRTGEPLTEPLRHDGPVWSARFSPDGRFVITASSDGTAQVWDVRPGAAVVLGLPISRAVKAVEWSSDGQWLLQTAGWSGVWNAKNGGLVNGTYLARGKEVLFSRFSPDAQFVVSTGDDGTARIWNTLTARAVPPPLRHDGTVHYASFSLDGSLLATASIDHTARIWEVHTGTTLFQPLTHDDIVYSVEFSPDGRIVVTACADKFARVWDFRAGKLSAPPLAHQDQVVSARFSPDGQRIVTASHDHSAQVWDAHSGKLLCQPLKHGGPVQSARFSPDGERVVTASSDGTARVWNTRTGNAVTEPLVHEDRVHTADFSPTGEYVVTASADGTARLWNARTSQPLSSPLSHRGPVNFAEFSPDGRWVATASSDWWVRITEIMVAGPPIPEWLPQLTEAVAGKRINAQHGVEYVAPRELLRLGQELQRELATNSYTAWAKWFFRDRANRPLSPSALLTVSAYLQKWAVYARESPNAIKISKLREMVCLVPTNGAIYAQLAQQIAAQDPTRYPYGVAEADFLNLRAMLLSRVRVQPMLARAELLAHQGDMVAALEEIDRIIRFSPPDPLIWVTRGSLLEKAVQLEAAYASFNRMVEVTEASTGWSRQDKEHWLRERNEFLTRHPECRQSEVIGRLILSDEARATYLRTHRISPRDPLTPARLIDLTPHFLTGLDWPRPTYIPYAPGLGKLTQQPLVCEGVEFDARGLIQVCTSGQRVRFPELPERVDGIGVRQHARRLHFLHTTPDIEARDAVIGRYIVHYTGGATLEVPVVYGRDMIHWTNEPPQDATSPRLAWTGPTKHGINERFYLTTWNNPKPEVEIMSLDLVSDLKRAAVALVAITAEP